MIESVATSLSIQSELRAFVHAEHEAGRAHLKRLWAKPVDERVEEGRCVVGAWIKESKGGRELVLGVDGNDSRFREGDFVRLSLGDPNTPLSDAMVIDAEDNAIEIRLTGRSASKLNLPPGFRGLQLDESRIDLENLYLGAIEELARTHAGRDRILPLLNGTLLPKLDIETFEAAAASAEKEGFHDDQAKAIAAALATDVCWLIHGPPGTGKTRVLARVVSELLKNGERVLVTSATHRTINNLLEAIAAETGDRRNIAKITAFNDRSLGVAQFESFAESPFGLEDRGYVLGATPFALRTKRLSGVDFDTIIVDEASQVNLPLAVMAMLAGKRYIFAGDHCQLPPVCLSVPAADSGETSIFGRLIGRGMDTMLTVTHRLNDALCEWPSESFYLSRLVPSPPAAQRRLRLNPTSPEFVEILAPDPSAIWVAVPHTGSMSSSPEEIEIAAAILMELRNAGCDWKDVGVVVPFRRQARLLRQRIWKKLRESPVGLGLVADTVERMQGQEREVIIVSFATSDVTFAARLAEFLFQPQRLNVAASRARTKLILLASPDLLDFAESSALNESLRAPFVTLLRSAHRVDMH